MADLLSHISAAPSALGVLVLVLGYVGGAAIKKWDRGGTQVQADSFGLIDRLQKNADTSGADAVRERNRANRFQRRYYHEHVRRVRREDYAHDLEVRFEVPHRVWDDELDDDQDEGDTP